MGLLVRGMRAAFAGAAFAGAAVAWAVASQAAFAQGYDTALDDFRALAAAVDEAAEPSAPAGASALYRARRAWDGYARSDAVCPLRFTVNGIAVEARPVESVLMQDASERGLLLRRVAAVWHDDREALALGLALPFDLTTGDRLGSGDLEGGYFPSPKAEPAAIVGDGRWLGADRAGAFPPIDRLWGAVLSHLARLLPELLRDFEAMGAGRRPICD